MLIAFEGIDGAGKSTQLARLAASLRSRGIEPVTVPRHSALRQLYRELISSADTFPDPPTSLLFGAAVVSDMHQRWVRDDGRLYICHRHLPSPLSDGLAFGMTPRVIAELWRTLPRPDVTILIETEPEVALARKAHVSLAEAGGPLWLERASSMEEAFLAYQTAAADGFRAVGEMASSSGAGWISVRGDVDTEVLQERILEAVIERTWIAGVVAEPVN